jgi:hypothetical protein
MRRAWAAFSPDFFQRASSEPKRRALRGIIFGLSFFHSLLLGRKKFGTGGLAGWLSAWHVDMLCVLFAIGLPFQFWVCHNVPHLILLSNCQLPSPSPHPGRPLPPHHPPAGIGGSAAGGGGLGYCRAYSFNQGDLATCGDVIRNYVEASKGGGVPWQDLRYLLGQVFYGESSPHDCIRVPAGDVCGCLLGCTLGHCQSAASSAVLFCCDAFAAGAGVGAGA